MPLIVASYIEQSWSNARQAGKTGKRAPTMSNRQTPRMPDRGTNTVLLAPTVVALWFLDSFAFRYLTMERERFGINSATVPATM